MRAVDSLKLETDPTVRVFDLTINCISADGTLKADLFTPEHIHLSFAGYAVYAERLKPLLEIK